MRNNFIYSVLFSLLIISCKSNTANKADLGSIANEYVKLGLTIGQYDPDFVDAYYGPDSLKPLSIDSAAQFPKDSLLKAIETLKNKVKNVSVENNDNDSLQTRANWMLQQLTAFSRRVKIFSGEYANFDEEAKELFGVLPPTRSEDHFKTIITQLDSLLPGKGSVPARVKALEALFQIPVDKIDTVFRTAIAEAKKRTYQHFKLPETETFTLEYVKGTSWSGYNWYKGNFTSLIQINTDLPIRIERAIDLACHEGYPGHHVYNMMLEKNLYKDKGWVDVSLYPLFSPQSLIAEGSANYGIEVAFPGKERIAYAKQVLIPLAGLDTTNTDKYFQVLSIKAKLNYARNEVASGLINGTMPEAEAKRWLVEYGLYSEEEAAKSIRFIRKYRSYVINYNYGLDMVRNYIERNGGTSEAPSKRWQLFEWLLSNPVRPADLQ